MKEKTTHRTGGKIVFKRRYKEFISKTGQQGLCSSYQKPNNLIEKWTKELSGHLSREGIQVARKHMQRCSASRSTREMQIRSSMRYHFTPVSMAISDCRQQKNAGGGVERREPPTLGAGSGNQCIQSGEQRGGPSRHSATKCHVTQPSHAWAWILTKPNFQKIPHANSHGITG